MNTRPQHLGKYELLERLERGGMGEVWKAYDTQLRRHVAIKLLNTSLQADPNFVSLFTREAQFVASLHHPNIVQVHDFQFTDAVGSEATAYMVMDYIEGGTLADYIRETSCRGQFPPASDIVYLFTSISLALDYAHQRGMIHRDIKPANILLDKRNPLGRSMGEPVLTDFGIARMQGTAISTLTSSVVGTPRYLSPEQAQGRPSDERSDLYSLGIILYELVTGTTPFRGDNPLAIMMQHIYETPPEPTTFNPNISPALSSVVLQSIAKDPEQRFSTASAMTIALAQALNVPIPASLHKPVHIDVEHDYNPLQPRNLLSDSTRTRAPSNPRVSQPASFILPVDNKIETEVITPVHHTPALASTRSAPLSPALVQSPSFPVSPPFQRKRWTYIALIVCGIILLVSAGVGTASLLITHLQQGVIATPNATGAVVGWMAFSSNKQGTYDQIEVHLRDVPAPPAGKTYYAWLDNSNEAVPPRWPLCNNHGIVNCSFSDVPQNRNLLAQYDWFLITVERADTTPDIPYPGAGRYYAVLSHNGPTRFDVKMCPASNASVPC